MGSSTPRKSRHRPQPSGSGGAPKQVPASDYESDAPSGGPSTQLLQAPQVGRTIGDLNLAVLKRYVPSIQSYIAMSHNATVYQLDSDTMGWGEATTKGPLFVCNQDPDESTGQAVPRACVFVMNRQGLENLIIDLKNVIECELENQFVMLRTVAPSGEEVVSGLYMDASGIHTSWAAIQEMWKAVRNEA